jgi:hypothetical protein
VPVKADLTDLQEKIAWCRANDDQCREIAGNARQLYRQFVSKDGILDYMQVRYTVYMVYGMVDD